LQGTQKKKRHEHRREERGRGEQKKKKRVIGKRGPRKGGANGHRSTLQTTEKGLCINPER